LLAEHLIGQLLVSAQLQLLLQLLSHQLIGLHLLTTLQLLFSVAKTDFVLKRPFLIFDYSFFSFFCLLKTHVFLAHTEG
jgi:hypothetical protein